MSASKEDFTGSSMSHGSDHDHDDHEPITSSSLGGELVVPNDELDLDNETRNNNNNNNNKSNAQVRGSELKRRKYSLSELVNCLNQKEHDSSTLPPELYRRVLDYRLAQGKRLEKYGPTKKWGIYGVYLHLRNVRTDLEWAEDAAWRRQNHQPYCSWSDFDALKQKHVIPYFTYGLMAICTIMLVVEFAVNGWKVEPLDQNPLIGPSAETLVKLGALDTPKIIEQGQWFRIFTACILHAGIVHWIVNVAAIYFFGGVLEQSHGLWNAILLFWVPAVGGNLLSAIFLPQYISVGASGGLFGFMGACLADITVHWNLIFLKDCSEADDSNVTWKRNFWALFWLVVEIAVEILMGLTPYVDNFIHLGGFFYGILCGWTVIEYDALNFLGYQASLFTKVRMFALRFVGLVACIVFIVITSIFLATMELGDTPCPNCRYFNCVPFPSAGNPWWHCDDCTQVSAELYRTTNGDTSYYSRIDLTCPDDVVETINVTTDSISSKDTMTEKLPDYCRSYCDEIYKR